MKKLLGISLAAMTVFLIALRIYKSAIDNRPEFPWESQGIYLK